MNDYLFPYTHTIGYLVLNPYIESRVLLVYVKINSMRYIMTYKLAKLLDRYPRTVKMLMFLVVFSVLMHLTYMITHIVVG